MDAEQQVLSRKWFYNFKLPSGRITDSYIPPQLLKIHDTRLTMLNATLDPLFKDKWKDTTCVDLACHEGYFSLNMAGKGCRSVLGIDGRKQHVDDAESVRKVFGYSNVKFEHHDIYTVKREAVGTFDVVLMLGLLYHVENPIGALALARSLTKRVCVLETQLAPNLTDPKIEWGTSSNFKDVMGSFAVIDETDDLTNPEASIAGICLVPSLEALVWVMKRLGFSRVEVLTPPADAYEQLASGKRVMVAGYID